MARIRTTKPEFWVSEQVAECSTNARLLFLGMWNFCDDNGVHPAKAGALKAEVFPFDPFTKDQINEWVNELISVDLVGEFSCGTDTYWFVTGWNKHQKIDKPSRKYPGPFDEGSTIIRRILGEPSPPEWKGMEGNGVEGNSEAKASGPAAPLPSPPDSVPSDKELVWSIGIDLLGESASNRKLIGRLVNDHGEKVLAEVLMACVAEAPGEPKSWIVAACIARGKRSQSQSRTSSGGEDLLAAISADPRPRWAINAGFDNRWEAENSLCFEHNAHQFRDGKRLEAH